MTATIDDLDVVVHPGRRGRVVVARVGPGQDAATTARRSVEHTARVRARWLVVDLSAAATRDVVDLLQHLHRHGAHAGVGLVLAGGEVGEGEVAGSGAGCLVFPTVPAALGTLGAL